LNTAPTVSKKSRLIPVLLAAVLTLVIADPSFGQSLVLPEGFGLVDVTPNNLSGETNQNSEPSLGVGTGDSYGKMIVHTFGPGPSSSSPANYYYTVAEFGVPIWTQPGQVLDQDTTLDWSTGGICYMASLYEGSLKVRESLDPATQSFSTIVASTYTAPPNAGYPDQPWVRVVNVNGTDHIFVGFNDLSRSGFYGGMGDTASIRYSLDGGTTWNNTVIEKAIPGAAWDSPAVRLAASADGKTVYALFKRANSWTGDDFGSDFVGDVVLVRDDNSGGAGYGALGGGNGTLLAHNVEMGYSGGTSLGAQRLGADCDVAINPAQPGVVYVAYTEVLNGVPVIRVQSSADSGASFSLVYSITNAAIPALAVTTDGKLGLLYTMTSLKHQSFRNFGKNLEVHFLKAIGGKFTPGNFNDRILAMWPNNNPIRSSNPYIGDFFSLKAVGYSFFGAFCASGDPQPGNFPSGVFYQRNVKVSGSLKKNFSLSSSGTLADLSGNAVAPSIDPFVFYDTAALINLPLVNLRLPFFYDPVDPNSGTTHLGWAVLPANQPQFQLQSSPTFGPAANWTLAPSNMITQANGAFGAVISGTQPQQFYRLNQNLTGAQFNTFASVDQNGALSTTGVVTTAAGGTRTFTATPNLNYAVGNWYLDGVPVPSNGSSLTVSNIADEHTVVASFVASNDLAVTISEFPDEDGPTVTSGTNFYVINVANQGLNLLTGIVITNLLDPKVEFLSVTTSQGSVANTLTGNLGSLSPGASATITINFATPTAGSVTDIVNVACSQFEPDLANNTATDITTVYDPAIITNQPSSQAVLPGGTAFFSVGVSGTRPFTYQWFLNGAPIDNATNPVLTLLNVTTAQAGDYSVSVYQTPGAEDIMEADSDPAALTVISLPAVTTLAASAVTTSSAQLNGSVNPNGGSTIAYFEYGLTAGYGSSTTSVGMGSGTAAQLAAATLGLASATTYHYRIDAYNVAGTNYGADTIFATAWPPVPPKLLSPGAVKFDGAQTLTNLTPTFTWTAANQAASSDLIISQYPYGSGNIVATLGVGKNSSLALPGGILQPGTRYAWYMVSFNSIGDESAASAPFYFKTPSAPAVTTLAATDVGFASATMNGSVNPNGVSTTAYFQYGITTGYGLTTASTAVGSGITAQTFSAPTGNIQAGTSYHFRIVATNSLGTSYGLDMSF
jgi:Domain of unknown function DUF11